METLFIIVFGFLAICGFGILIWYGFEEGSDALGKTNPLNKPLNKIGDKIDDSKLGKTANEGLETIKELGYTGGWGVLTFLTYASVVLFFMALLKIVPWIISILCIVITIILHNTLEK